MLLRLVESLLLHILKLWHNCIFAWKSMPYLFLAGLVLEVISVMFRSISLGFRLLANVSSGHILGDIALSVRFSFVIHELPLLYIFYLITFTSV